MKIEQFEFRQAMQTARGIEVNVRLVVEDNDTAILILNTLVAMSKGSLPIKPAETPATETAARARRSSKEKEEPKAEPTPTQAAATVVVTNQKTGETHTFDIPKIEEPKTEPAPEAPKVEAPPAAPAEKELPAGVTVSDTIKTATKLREVLNDLMEQGLKTQQELTDACLAMQKQVPVLSRIQDLGARVPKAAELLGILK